MQPIVLPGSEYTMHTCSREPVLDEHPDRPPWMQPDAFPTPPQPDSFGYRQGKESVSCSQQKLTEQIERDVDRAIALVWEPGAPTMLPPEQLPWLFEALVVRERAHLKKSRFSAILNTLTWSVLVALGAATRGGMAQFQLFMAVSLGLIPLVEHSWGLYRLRSYTPTAMAQRVPEARSTAWLSRQRAPWTWALVICVSCIGVLQLVLGLWFFLDPQHSSIAAAGIVKPAVRAGEWWRLLTGTLLHASIIHFLFNIVALFVLGKLIEVTFHRVYVPIVFVLAALSGSLCSLIWLPETTSVGASGGILGLLGFMLVLSWSQGGRFPHAIRRGLVLSIVYVIIAGLLAAQAIDNAAHIGGLIAGAALGALLAHERAIGIRDHPSAVIVASSIVAGTVILLATAWALLQMIS